MFTVNVFLNHEKDEVMMLDGPLSVGLHIVILMYSQMTTDGLVERELDPRSQVFRKSEVVD